MIYGPPVPVSLRSFSSKKINTMFFFFCGTMDGLASQKRNQLIQYTVWYCTVIKKKKMTCTVFGCVDATRKSNWNTVQVIFIACQLPLADTHTEKDDNLGFCLWGHIYSHIGISTQRRDLRRGYKNTLRRIKLQRWDRIYRGGGGRAPEVYQSSSNFFLHWMSCSTVHILGVKSVFFQYWKSTRRPVATIKKCV